MRMLYLEVKESAWIDDTSRKSGSASSLLLLLPLPTGFFPSNWRFWLFFLFSRSWPLCTGVRSEGKSDRSAGPFLCLLSLPVTGRSGFFPSDFTSPIFALVLLHLSPRSFCSLPSHSLPSSSSSSSSSHFHRTKARSWLTSIKLPDSVMSNCCGGCCWLNDSQRVRESPWFTKACIKRKREGERKREMSESKCKWDKFHE